MLIKSLLFLIPAALASATSLPTNFYLVTTSQKTPCQNSTNLADVSAISTFDPYYQENFLIRKIDRGYNSLPVFNLKNGNLQTIASMPHGGPLATYTTRNPRPGKELMFNAAPTTAHGAFTIHDGVIAYRGKFSDWYTCPGAFGEEVIVYQGKATGCQKVYLHAVAKPPY